MKASLIVIGVLVTGLAMAQKAPVRVNEKRMETRIFELAKFGRDEQGRGYRVAFTKGDQEGRAWLMGLMKNAGLEVNIDHAGNIIGKREGKNAELKPIAFGSHIDMVPDGGNYDGCVGSIGALEMIEVLNDSKITTQHPLQVIIFSNEEGGTVGSNAMIGHLDEKGLGIISQSGLTMAAGIKAIGGNPDSIAFSVKKPGDFKAFLELHIEQGGTLEKEKTQIGVVAGIVGIEHWDVVVEGFANHAGTTPMNMRKDAMLAAAKFIVMVNEVMTGHQGQQVGTVGRVEAKPGAYNVIPGKVTLGLEIRDLSYEKIWQLFKEIEGRTSAIAESSGTAISFQYQPNPSKPALTDKTIQEKIATSAKGLGFTYRFMPSGAGHDAQEMARITSVGMIFVPSAGGISHSPKEFTKASDMANGANVLLQTILLIDKEP